MHLIAACSDCHRQYRVEGMAPGSKMRCPCGGLVAVPKDVLGLEAHVVRCSSCGAPREAGTLACSSCFSDFTLHERDLQTVCPECLARISDNAKYCHHCGVAIVPEVFPASVGSNFACPACSQEPAPRLNAREVGTSPPVPFHECPSCAGMWLGQESFADLVKRNERAGYASSLAWLFPTTQVLSEDGAKKAAPPRFYRRCPVCQETMVRRNFADHSGVIIDVCSGHGVWFDCNELSAILKWVREGGMSRGPTTHAPQFSSPASKGGYEAQRTYGRPEQGFLGILMDSFLGDTFDTFDTFDFSNFDFFDID